MSKSAIYLASVLVVFVFINLSYAEFFSETYISGQSFITTIAFSPDGRMYFFEKETGLIKVVLGRNSVRADPFFHFEVNNLGERGGLGLRFHPDYPDSPYVYCYVTIPQPVLANVIVRLVDSLGYGVHPDTIFRAPITVSATNHNGGYMRFGPDGKLYFTMGENGKDLWAQDTCRVQGKILRINADGSIPSDNPIHCAPIFTYGNRNSFGICFHPVTGALYESENGPTENDEINLLLPGRNYGWPIVECMSNDTAFVNAMFCWTPTIAPTGIILAWNSAIPEFNGQLLMTDFNTGTLHLLTLDETGDSILADDHIYNAGVGLIDVEQGPDGYFYLSGDGSIIRVRPPRIPPEPFPLIAPTNNWILTNDSLTFMWGNTSDADSNSSFQFRFQFSPDSTFNNRVASINRQIDTTLTISTDLLDYLGNIIYWRVQAIDNDSMITIGGRPHPEFRSIHIVPTGDANRNGSVNTLDILFMVNFLGHGGPFPDPLLAADVNGDCAVNAMDIAYFVRYFMGGPLLRRGNCQ